MKIFALTLAAAFVALPALAQDKTPAAGAAPAAAAPAAPEAEMPKHGCAQPALPGRNTTVSQAKKLEQDASAYRTCLVAFSAQMQAEANARIKAANASVEEYNGYAKRVNEAMDEAEKVEKEDAAAAKALRETKKIPKK